MRGHDWASTIDVNYNSNLVQIEVFQNRVGRNFNPEVGFVDRTDIVSNSIDTQLSPRPKQGRIREYNFEAFYRRHEDTNGVLQTQEWQTTFRANFHNGAYTDDDLFDNFIQRLNSPFNIFKNVLIPPGLYHFDRERVPGPPKKVSPFVTVGIGFLSADVKGGPQFYVLSGGTATASKFPPLSPAPGARMRTTLIPSMPESR